MGHTKNIIQFLQNYLLKLQTLETLLTGCCRQLSALPTQSCWIGSSQAFPEEVRFYVPIDICLSPLAPFSLYLDILI